MDEQEFLKMIESNSRLLFLQRELIDLEKKFLDELQQMYNN